jgi:hypothetical protein
VTRIKIDWIRGGPLPEFSQNVQTCMSLFHIRAAMTITRGRKRLGDPF